MEWLTLVTLEDGSEVQSRMGTSLHRESDLHDYRICYQDGAVREFASMLEVTRHLHTRHDLHQVAVGRQDERD